MRYIAVDTETSGVNTQTCNVLELGWVVWDTERRTPLALANRLIHGETTAEAQAVNGITQDDLASGGDQFAGVMATLRGDIIVWEPTHVVGHNLKSYDMPILARLTPGVHPLFGLTLFDTMLHIPGFVGKKLVHAMAEAGVILPVQLRHRAVFDALGCCMLLDAVREEWPFEKLTQRLAEPMVRFQSLQVRADNEKAKALGFGFDWDRKQWLLELPASEVAAMLEKAQAAGVRVQRV